MKHDRVNATVRDDRSAAVRGQFSRRDWLVSLAASLGVCLIPDRWAHAAPQTNPLAVYQLNWTSEIRWNQVLDVSTIASDSDDERVAKGQALLSKQGGGVLYFPAGVYTFRSGIRLLSGIVLRGAAPAMIHSAHHPQYALATRFEFPAYAHQNSGAGTSIANAFHGVTLADPTNASHVGLMDIAFNRATIHFADDGTEQHRAGTCRFVVGCSLRNAAVADSTVPNLNMGQYAWQRATARHHAAIDVKAERNILIANNQLPRSGQDNFTMDGFRLLDARKQLISIDGVIFDYDNRPGIYVNHYAIGGAGGSGPDGTPETHPHGFRQGIVIRDNFIFNTGRMAIGFCGDGVICSNNRIRFAENVWRPTVTGQQVTTGSSTNDNRAVEMRGWRWKVAKNDYVVHRNWAFDRKYRINDGEGLMHEDHVNSTIRDSELLENQGNTYLSLYKTAGIDGLRVESNEIRLGDGKQTIANGSAIFVSADRTKDRFPCRNVTIVNNALSGGGILVSGMPSENNVIRGNRNLGAGVLPIQLGAVANVEENQGFEVKKIAEKFPR